MYFDSSKLLEFRYEQLNNLELTFNDPWMGTTELRSHFLRSKGNQSNYNVEVLNILTWLTEEYAGDISEFKPYKEFALAVPDHVIDILKYIVEKTNSIYIKARLSDIIWLSRKREIDFCRIAIDSYFDYIMLKADYVNWVSTFYVFKRLIVLSKSISESSRIEDIKSWLFRFLEEHNSDEPSHLPTSCFEELAKMKLLSSEDYKRARELLQELIKNAQNCNKWIVANEACSFLISSLRKEDPNSGLIDAVLKKVELTLLGQGTCEGNPMARAIQLKEAIGIISSVDSFSSYPALKQKRDELLSEYPRVCKLYVDQIKPVTFNIKIENLIEQLKGPLEGRSIEELMVFMGVYLHPTPKETIEEYARKNEDQIRRLITRQVTDEDGLLQGVFSDSEEDWLKESTLEYCMTIWGLRAVYILEVFLKHIEDNHLDFRDFVIRTITDPWCRFVPENRRGIFYRGLMAGFHRDFITANHLLVPQIENSLRHELKKIGVVTIQSWPEKDDEFSLGKLLKDNEECRKALSDPCLLGENLRIELENLYVERMGPNVRNRICHGKVSDESFKNQCFVVSWARILLLCFLPTQLAQSTYKKIDEE